MSEREIYGKLKKKALELSKTLSPPEFYQKYAADIRLSERILRNSILTKQCINHLNLTQETMGHGFDHSIAVAVDAGAIVNIEGTGMGIPEGRLKDLIVASHVAGLLHDIKRGEEDHAVEGSKEAGRFLDGFGMEDWLKRYVVVAIRNHEAFGSVVTPDDEFGALVSNALYDADKFRWGVDNFTVTVWEMLEAGNKKLKEFIRNYNKSLEYIEKVKGTFRTETGKKYGPEIIDKGLQVGRMLYSDIEKLSGC
ncbi:hypothetical protein BMS3Bbin06_00477 [bacterium BMS3Bbin06]|nr:hypothetical protein BMS3Abin08_02131 [bacterium BMS3Abin08]GBE33961.1 hypothetical protein BMS3Bbin06_00477 [bacterium BMS3Bbin06]